ncbi:hypothetical protein ASPWEDRAFT_491033 [Aspergillus wentii DTO 134E9]|uniref:Uncharacterized protein n=1 Tax=Aspergillus wentii DTO 134E9 TaxID=1073089 RepID=A0A1L9RJJ3_ASPWE|nr:uncharacterized protein ASPWEDRAFT_491033 [Aspergillus wentii DTO 134E9]OJJ35085.1 hypothetical protein ASPWEDRAFT_491033 [Aspergillus wentii DTO 134E9]
MPRLAVCKDSDRPRRHKQQKQQRKPWKAWNVQSFSSLEKRAVRGRALIGCGWRRRRVQEHHIYSLLKLIPTELCISLGLICVSCVCFDKVHIPEVTVLSVCPPPSGAAVVVFENNDLGSDHQKVCPVWVSPSINLEVFKS